MIMLYENFRHRGKSFILSANEIAANGGSAAGPSAGPCANWRHVA